MGASGRGGKPALPGKRVADDEPRRKNLGGDRSSSDLSSRRAGKNYPLFIEKRAYQGSTGKVYPLPVTEKVSDVCREVAYHAVWLENEYLRVMVLPELGGRIHRALDKTNGYDFVYYNHVVKPALVG